MNVLRTKAITTRGRSLEASGLAERLPTESFSEALLSHDDGKRPSAGGVASRRPDPEGRGQSSASTHTSSERRERGADARRDLHAQADAAEPAAEDLTPGMPRRRTTARHFPLAVRPPPPGSTPPAAPAARAGAYGPRPAGRAGGAAAAPPPIPPDARRAVTSAAAPVASGSIATPMALGPTARVPAPDPTGAAATVSPATAAVLAHVAHDPSLRAALSADEARLSLSTAGGDLLVHISLHGQRTDLRVVGAGAAALERHAAELHAALVAQGLTLGTIAVAESAEASLAGDASSSSTAGEREEAEERPVRHRHRFAVTA
jgi:hypothetical protein